MRKLCAALAGILVGGLLPLTSVSADTISVSQEIHIRAVVPQLRTIIVDDYGNIKEIDSNTSQNVIPQVYQGSIKSTNQLVLTAGLLQKYQAIIVTRNTHHTGILYKSSTLQQPVMTPLANKSTLGLLLAQIAVLFN